MVDEIRLTPPLRANLRMAGFVMPVRASFSDLCLLALPKPLPLPLPDILKTHFMGHCGVKLF